MHANLHYGFTGKFCDSCRFLRDAVGNESKGECPNRKCENSKQKNAKEGISSSLHLMKNVLRDA